MLAYEQLGQGPAVVLLHAFPLDRCMWHAQVSALAAAGYCAIAPDLPGFGESKDAVARDLADYADSIADLLDVLKIEQAAIVGLSMGGYIAIQFVARHAARVSALVLADTRAAADPPEAKKGRDANIARAHKEGSLAVFEAMKPRVFFAGSEPTKIAKLAQLAAAQTPQGVALGLAMMRDRPDQTPLLGSIAVSTLTIAGELDVASTSDQVREMASQIKGAQFVAVAAAGHYTNCEQPADFNRALLSFLDRTLKTCP